MRYNNSNNKTCNCSVVYSIPLFDTLSANNQVQLPRIGSPKATRTLINVYLWMGITCKLLHVWKFGTTNYVV